MQADMVFKLTKEEVQSILFEKIFNRLDIDSIVGKAEIVFTRLESDGIQMSLTSKEVEL